MNIDIRQLSANLWRASYRGKLGRYTVFGSTKAEALRKIREIIARTETAP